MQSLFHSVTSNISTGCNVIIIPFHVMEDWFHLTLCNDYSISRKYSISRCVIIIPPDTMQYLRHLTRCNNNSTSHNLIIIPSHAIFSTRSQGLLKKLESWQQELISLLRNTKAQNKETNTKWRTDWRKQSKPIGKKTAATTTNKEKVISYSAMVNLNKNRSIMLQVIRTSNWWKKNLFGNKTALKYFCCIRFGKDS